MKYIWYKVRKSFKGGGSEFQIKVPDINLTKETWDELLEWIGENTGGGHAYGYRIHTNKLKRKSRKLKVVSYPSHISGQFFRMGTLVTTKYTQRIIG